MENGGDGALTNQVSPAIMTKINDALYGSRHMESILALVVAGEAREFFNLPRCQQRDILESISEASVDIRCRIDSLKA